MHYKTFIPPTTVILLISVLFSFSSCNSGSKGAGEEKNDSLKGKISISGAFALYPLTVKWAEEYQKLHPKVTINVSAGGAGKGMADALSHMVDLGMYSKEVSKEEISKGAWYIPVAKDAVLPTINEKNPVLKELKTKGLTRDKFYDIFVSGKISTWGMAAGNGSRAEMQVFTRSDACGAAEMWAKFLNGKKQEDLQGVGVNGDPGVADAVKRNVNAIGYNNLNFCYDMMNRKKYEGLEVIPIDINNNGLVDQEENFYGNLDEVMNAIKDGRYPSPPARDLYFVAGGKPQNPVIVAFLKWVLGDGQKYLHEAGYIVLTDEKIQTARQQLNK